MLKQFRRKKMTAKVWPYIFLSPYFIVYLIFGFFPILYTFYLSFTDWDGISKANFVGFYNYIYLFTKDPYFFKALLNTVVLMVIYIPLMLIIGLLLAAALYSSKLPFKKVFQLGNFLPYITVPVAVGIIFSLLFDYRTGLINRLLIQFGASAQGVDWLGGDAVITRIVMIIMIVWQNAGYFMVIYLAGMSSISGDVYEAARVDGSSSWNTFWKITVPLLRPVTLFLVITGIINGLQLFDQPMLLISGGASNNTIMAGGPGRTLLTVMWYFYDKTFGTGMDYGYGAAISYGLFIFIAIFCFMYFKFMNREDKN